MVDHMAEELLTWRMRLGEAEKADQPIDWNRVNATNVDGFGGGVRACK